MREEVFEVVCPTCGRKNEVRAKVNDDGFNHWEDIPCAWCGLAVDTIRAASVPKTKIIGDAPEDSEGGN
jgi:endogenous inhibitor of DNA gyrase (YacG/DUF329 family)